MTTAKPERNPFIDRLRVWVVLTLIPFHAALNYLKGMGYIHDDTGGYPVVLCFMTYYLYHFFMDLLFVVSGYSSFHSCAKRGPGRFLKERSKKLLAVFILGFALICPVTAYFTGVLHHGFRGTILSFFGEFFSPKIVNYLGWGHFWFLLYLFIISIITVPVLRRFFPAQDDNKTNPVPVIVFFLAGQLLVEAILRPLFPSNNMVIGDYANLASYGISFVFGWVLAQRKGLLSFVADRYKTFLTCGIIAYSGLTVLFLLGLGGYISFFTQLSVMKTGPGTAPHLVLFQTGTGFYCFSWVLFWIGFGKIRLNKKTETLGFLSRYSFMIYIWHCLPITAIAFFMYNLKVNAYAKWAVVTGGSSVTLLLFIVLYDRFLRFIRHR